MNGENSSLKNKSLAKVFLAVLTVFLVVLIIYTVVSIQNSIKEGRYIGDTVNTITVTETGEIYTKPDLVLASFSVITEAETVSEALSVNTENMNSIIDFVKSQGIEEKDLKTTSFNIYPRYEYLDDGGYYSSERVLVSYEVSQNLQVKIRDLEIIGFIIEGATAAGANNVGDLQFTVDDQEDLKKQARNQAIDKAKGKAKELASDLDVKLIRIVDFSESSYSPVYDYAKELSSTMGIGGGGPEVPQIESGESKITVTVSVTYEIN